MTKFLFILMSIFSIGAIIIGCGRSNSRKSCYYMMDSASVEVVEETSISSNEDNEEDGTYLDPKKISTAQLDAFALMGDVHIVKYDSLILKFDRQGELEYFGFNDSINLLHNVEYKEGGKSQRLAKWGDNGWEFEISSQDIWMPSSEAPIVDFKIYYPEGGFDRYIVKKRPRPGTPSPADPEYKKNRARTVTLSVEYRNFRRKGDVPRPDIFLYDKYEYDEYGNWVSRRAKSEHSPTKHETRTITYYSRE